MALALNNLQSLICHKTNKPNQTAITKSHTTTITMATCLPSRKLSKLDEPGTQDTAGGAETSS